MPKQCIICYRDCSSSGSQRLDCRAASKSHSRPSCKIAAGACISPSSQCQLKLSQISREHIRMSRQFPKTMDSVKTRIGLSSSAEFQVVLHPIAQILQLLHVWTLESSESILICSMQLVESTVSQLSWCSHISIRSDRPEAHLRAGNLYTTMYKGKSSACTRPA